MPATGQRLPGLRQLHRKRLLRHRQRAPTKPRHRSAMKHWASLWSRRRSGPPRAHQARPARPAPVARAATPSDSTKASSSPRTTEHPFEAPAQQPPSATTAGQRRNIPGEQPAKAVSIALRLLIALPRTGPTVPRKTASGASHPPKRTQRLSPWRRACCPQPPRAGAPRAPRRNISPAEQARYRETARHLHGPEGPSASRADGRRRASFRKRNAPRAARDGQRPRGRAPHRFRGPSTVSDSIDQKRPS